MTIWSTFYVNDHKADWDQFKGPCTDIKFAIVEIVLQISLSALFSQVIHSMSNQIIILHVSSYLSTSMTVYIASFWIVDQQLKVRNVGWFQSWVWWVASKTWFIGQLCTLQKCSFSIQLASQLENLDGKTQGKRGLNEISKNAFSKIKYGIFWNVIMTQNWILI